MKSVKYLSIILFLCSMISTLGLAAAASQKASEAKTTIKSSPDINGNRKGELRNTSAGELEAWSVKSQAWINPKAFWLEYAAERGGLTWGERDTYPPYNQVKELDTMIIQLDSGICMMEFWHRRWRRANDVRRWDEKFTNYSACSIVFD